MADDPAFFEKSIRDAHVAAYSALLNERSVKVIDPEGMSELVPDAVVANYLGSVRDGMIEHMLTDFEPSVFEALVEFVDINERTYGSPATPDDDGSDSLDEWSNSALSIGQDGNFLDDYANAMPLIAHMIGADMRLRADVEAKAHIHAPFLADMLETDGIFQFPNRIWRQDLIREARGETR